MLVPTLDGNFSMQISPSYQGSEPGGWPLAARPDTPCTRSVAHSKVTPTAGPQSGIHARGLGVATARLGVWCARAVCVFGPKLWVGVTVLYVHFGVSVGSWSNRNRKRHTRKGGASAIIKSVGPAYMLVYPVRPYIKLSYSSTVDLDCCRLPFVQGRGAHRSSLRLPSQGSLLIGLKQARRHKRD